MCLPESCAARTTIAFFRFVPTAIVKDTRSVYGASQPTVNANFLQNSALPGIVRNFYDASQCSTFVAANRPVCVACADLRLTKEFQLHFRVEHNYCGVKNGFGSQLKREVGFFVLVGIGEKRFERSKARSEHSYDH